MAKAGIINADSGAIVGVPDAIVLEGGVWKINATAGGGAVPPSRTISTTAPLTGGGDLSANRTLAIPAATAGSDGYMTSTQVGTLATAASDATTALTNAAAAQATANAALVKANNLSDLTNVAAARTNLGLGTAATQNSTAFATAAQGTLADGAAQKSANLSDLSNASTARTNLGLGSVATLTADTDTTLAANSNSNVATQKAVKTYIDNLVTGVMKFVGSTDCSGNPNYPAAKKGEAYVVAVAGKIGGASGLTVEVGDVYVAIADNAGGTQAAVGASWDILQYNLVGALLSANNLSDLTNAVTARTNLGLGTAATFASSAFAQTANNLSDLASAATARTNLGLGTAATQNSTAFATAAQGTLASTAVQRAGDTMTGNLQVNAYVGIGAAPTTTFDIYQTDAGLNSNFRLRGNAQSVTVLDVASGTSGHYLFGYGAVPMQLATNGVARMTIASTGAITQTSGLTVQSGGITVTGQSQITGNVGIGAAPTTQFDVYAAAGSNANMRVRGNGGAAQFDFASGSGGHYLYGYGTLPVDFASNGVSRMTIAATGNITVKTSLQVGSSGTAITQQTVYTPTLTPAATAAAGFSKQTFTVTGLTTSDTVIVNGPNATNLSALVSFRVSAADTLELTWFCQSALTPAAGVYRIVAIRS
jgi:hypothetical protein